MVEVKSREARAVRLKTWLTVVFSGCFHIL